MIPSLPLKLQRLDVSNNTQLTTKSYAMIREVLLSDGVRSISYLNFEGNMMGDEGCKEICEGIKHSTRVKVVNLSKNNITDVGA